MLYIFLRSIKCGKRILLLVVRKGRRFTNLVFWPHSKFTRLRVLVVLNCSRIYFPASKDGELRDQRPWLSHLLQKLAVSFSDYAQYVTTMFVKESCDCGLPDESQSARFVAMGGHNYGTAEERSGRRSRNSFGSLGKTQNNLHPVAGQPPRSGGFFLLRT